MNEISNEIMSEFSKIRLKLIRETANGKNYAKVETWKEKIASELNEFRFENKTNGQHYRKLSTCFYYAGIVKNKRITSPV